MSALPPSDVEVFFLHLEILVRYAYVGDPDDAAEELRATLTARLLDDCAGSVDTTHPELALIPLTASWRGNILRGATASPPIHDLGEAEPELVVLVDGMAADAAALLPFAQAEQVGASRAHAEMEEAVRLHVEDRKGVSAAALGLRGWSYTALGYVMGGIEVAAIIAGTVLTGAGIQDYAALTDAPGAALLSHIVFGVLAGASFLTLQTAFAGWIMRAVPRSPRSAASLAATTGAVLFAYCAAFAILRLAGLTAGAGMVDQGMVDAARAFILFAGTVVLGAGAVHLLRKGARLRTEAGALHSAGVAIMGRLDAAKKALDTAVTREKELQLRARLPERLRTHFATGVSAFLAQAARGFHFMVADVLTFRSKLAMLRAMDESSRARFVAQGKALLAEWKKAKLDKKEA